MPEELPLTSYTPNLGVLKQGKTGLDLSKLVPQKAVCKDNKKAVVMTTRLMTTGQKIKNII